MYIYIIIRIYNCFQLSQSTLAVKAILKAIAPSHSHIATYKCAHSCWHPVFGFVSVVSQCLLTLLSTFYVSQCGYLLVKASVSNLNSIKCALKSFFLFALVSLLSNSISFYRRFIHFIIMDLLMPSFIFFFLAHFRFTRFAARFLAANCVAFKLCKYAMA